VRGSADAVWLELRQSSEQLRQLWSMRHLMHRNPILRERELPESSGIVWRRRSMSEELFL
jgi:hypothetical protein